MHHATDTVKNPREPFERLFSQFDQTFSLFAEQEGFVFDPKSGPNIGRSLRKQIGSLKKGVFLEIKNHWMESDPKDPEVILQYGVWYCPHGSGFPFYVLTRTLFEGKMSDLHDLPERLGSAIGALQEINADSVRKEGREFKRRPAEEGDDASK